MTAIRLFEAMLLAGLLVLVGVFCFQLGTMHEHAKHNAAAQTWRTQ